LKVKLESNEGMIGVWKESGGGAGRKVGEGKEGK